MNHETKTVKRMPGSLTADQIVRRIVDADTFLKMKRLAQSLGDNDGFKIAQEMDERFHKVMAEDFWYEDRRLPSEHGGHSLDAIAAYLMKSQFKTRDMNRLSRHVNRRSYRLD